MEETPIMVSVITLSYNHANYIRDCLEGVAKQQCNFAFEHFVHDDASTDGSAELIRAHAARYPDLVRPILQSQNQYSQGIAIGHTHIYPHVRGKYIAFCEGDDYWSDPHKLQKQVDFMESHPACGLVYTDVDFLDQVSGTITPQIIRSGKLNPPHSFEEHLQRAGYIAPCTWLFRREFIPQRPHRYVDGTFPLALDIWAASEVGFLPESTTVYRVLPESASHTTSLEKRYRIRAGILKIQKDYMEKYAHRCAKQLRQATLRRAYGTLFRTAIVLNKQEMLREMKLFYRQQSPFIWLYLTLLGPLIRPIQSCLYRLKGYQW